MFEDDDTRQYAVVVNAEGQYALWPVTKAVPEGWSGTGVSGTKAHCLEYVEREWTDMRPRSLIEGRST